MKYIDSEKLLAEIERQSKSIENATGDYAEGRRLELENIRNLVTSLQQEQPIQINTLTWKDINDLEEIINIVHYEFCNGIGAKSFGEEVLERFREGRDEQEQPEVDFEKAYKSYMKSRKDDLSGNAVTVNMKDMAHHFWNKGFNARKED